MKENISKIQFQSYFFFARFINSCGFEHIFVGETRGNEVTGFHNWIQFYLQESQDRLDYRGYFRRGTVSIEIRLTLQCNLLIVHLPIIKK